MIQYWISVKVRRVTSITSPRGSAWHCYKGRLLSKGKMLFSTSRPGKTNEYYGNKLGRRDNVDKIYKLTKFGADRLRNGASTWWWNITVLWLSSPAIISVSSASPQVAILVWFARLMAQKKTCSDWYTCLFRVWCLKFTLKESPDQKTAKLEPVKSGLFCKKIALTLEPLRVNYP